MCSSWVLFGSEIWRLPRELVSRHGWWCVVYARVNLPFRFCSAVMRVLSLVGSSTISMPNVARNCFCAPANTFLNSRPLGPSTKKRQQPLFRNHYRVVSIPFSLMPSLRMGVREYSQARA
jgi:hypothetical protein